MRQRAVLIVDDHPFFRLGIRQVIEGSGRFSIVAEAASGYEALHQAEILDPALVLIDAHLAGLNGIHVVAMLAKRHARSRIIMLSMDTDDEHLYQAVQAGAVAYLPKTVSSDGLLDTIDAVLRGEQPIHGEIIARPALATRVLVELHAASHLSCKPRVPSTCLPLSVREFAVLDCIVRGYNNRDAADALFINEQTVKNHMTRLLKKFDARSRLDLLRHAVLNGWVEFGRYPASDVVQTGEAVANVPLATIPAATSALLEPDWSGAIPTCAPLDVVMVAD